MTNPFLWHYKNYSLQYSFLPYLKDREFVLLPSKCDTKAVPIRNLRVNNIQQFQFIMDRLSAFQGKNIYNLYYSMAKYKDGIPFQDLKSLSSEDRDNHTWNKNAWREMVSYDMIIDIDSGSHDDMEFCIISAKNIKQLFDEHNVPYYMRFSGMGIHMVIPYEYFPKILHFNPHEDGNIYQLMGKINRELHDNYSEMVDYTVNDSRRIIKIPYSLSIYDNKYYICKPFNDFSLFKTNFFDYFDKPILEQINNPTGNIYNLCEAMNIQW